jgi:hypothetical protein
MLRGRLILMSDVYEMAAKNAATDEKGRTTRFVALVLLLVFFMASVLWVFMFTLAADPSLHTCFINVNGDVSTMSEMSVPFKTLFIASNATAVSSSGNITLEMPCGVMYKMLYQPAGYTAR